MKDELLFLLHNDRLSESGKRNLENYIIGLEERCAYLERSNDRREDTILGLRQEIYEQEDYKSRCEKAIEHIEEIWKSAEGGNIYVITIVGLIRADLLNILQNGIDDEQVEDVMNYKIDRQLDRIEKENSNVKD